MAAAGFAIMMLMTQPGRSEYVIPARAVAPRTAGKDLHGCGEDVQLGPPARAGRNVGNGAVVVRGGVGEELAPRAKVACGSTRGYARRQRCKKPAPCCNRPTLQRARAAALLQIACVAATSLRCCQCDRPVLMQRAPAAVTGLHCDSMPENHDCCKAHACGTIAGAARPLQRPPGGSCWLAAASAAVSLWPARQ
jgi:hypothetical protein